MVGWLAVQPVVGENFNQEIWLVINIYGGGMECSMAPGGRMVSNGFRQIWFKVTYMDYGGSLQFTTCVKI